MNAERMSTQNTTMHEDCADQNKVSSVAASKALHMAGVELSLPQNTLPAETLLAEGRAVFEKAYGEMDCN